MQSLVPGDTFQFACHPGVHCFTECCRELELALTPYDALELKNCLGISSQSFLDNHAVIEWPEEALHPHVYLGMIDDGYASCPFVCKEGCTVYDQRPAACRTYPVGRGAFLENDCVQQIYVLIKEPHCQGFSEPVTQTIATWQKNQAIESYNSFNDLLLPVLHHRIFEKKKRLSPELAEIFILALYNTDTFRQRIGEFDPDMKASTHIVPENDPDFLKFAIQWLDNFLSSSLSI